MEFIERFSPYLSIVSFLISVAALCISFRKFKIAKEALSFNIRAKQREWEKEKNASTKKLEVSISQTQTPKLSQKYAWLVFKVSLTNRSEFEMRIDSVELSFIKNGERLPNKLENHYHDPGKKIVISTRDKYDEDYGILVNQDKHPYEIFDNTIKAFVKDKEGDTFESEAIAVKVTGKYTA